MNIIVPVAITAAMIKTGTTIAEPAAGETAWVSGGTYAVGDLRIRATTHRVYACVQAHTGRTVVPENDAAYWLDKQPTARFAPFDPYISTAAATTGSISYVLQPGYVNSIALYGLVGTGISIGVKNASGGITTYSYGGSLLAPPTGWYSWLFGRRTQATKQVFTDIPISPTAEITITVSAGPADPVAIGMLVLGDYRPLVIDPFGGTEYGAKADPVTYSYIKTDEDGTTTIKRRHRGTNLSVSVMLSQSDADAALQSVQEVLDVPVAWIATDKPGYGGLNVFGIGSGSLSYDSFITAKMQITVKGMI